MWLLTHECQYDYHSYCYYYDCYYYRHYYSYRCYYDVWASAPLHELRERQAALGGFHAPPQGYYD